MDLNENKLKYVVSSDSTIEEAWSVIEENRYRSVIVVEGEKVVGTLSDGDIRKAILSKRLLSAPISEIMNVNFTSLTKDNKGKGEKIFREKDIFLIPVVDKNLKLIDIVRRW